jgi:hypothetical protein
MWLIIHASSRLSFGAEDADGILVEGSFDKLLLQVKVAAAFTLCNTHSCPFILPM